VIIYLLLFLFVPEVQNYIIEARQNLANLTEGSNYIWALLIALIICLIGSASIGFPVPFPFVLFSLSNSIFLRYSNQGLSISEILVNSSFWLEIMGIAIVGGLGAALGELTSFLLGRMYLYIFIAAALPIPDDPLWIALGMSEEKFSITKCLIAGWMGKTITTTFYVLLPILIILGISATGIEANDVSSVITEAIMLLVSLTIMFFILAFDWNKFLENRQNKSKNS
ncbi:MAG: hypothetical protein ACTSP6_12660, partial [Promethearchaeota archaeon]